MADQRLDQLYEDIDITEDELSVNREKLMHSLASESSQNATISSHSAKSNPSRRSRFWQKTVFWSALATAASLLIVFISTIGSSDLDSEGLKDIENFVARHEDHNQLLIHAESQKSSESPLRRLNALAVISLLGTEDKNKLASAAGLVEDPRPEFRAYYLEYLLDNADEGSYNIAYIEALIEREENAECLYLLGRLLKLALSNQNDLKMDDPRENASNTNKA